MAALPGKHDMELQGSSPAIVSIDTYPLYDHINANGEEYSMIEVRVYNPNQWICAPYTMFMTDYRVTVGGIIVSVWSITKPFIWWTKAGIIAARIYTLI